MSLFLFLTVLQAIVAAALVGVILMQQSEGGGLGMGGNPSGLMSARGAANVLTRATTTLAILFVVLSIVLAGLAVNVADGGAIDDSLDRTVAPANPLEGSNSEAGEAPASDTAPVDDPLAPASE